MTNGKAGRPNGWTAEEFIKAIPGTGGVISSIADRVGCVWHTAKKYIENHPTVKQAYENEKHKVDDKAVSNLLVAIKDGDLSISMWWVRMKMGDEFHPVEEHQQKVTMIEVIRNPDVDAE